MKSQQAQENDSSKKASQKPQILLTNDDGIQSLGLWAAAEALSRIGYVHVVAPRQQYSGAGRSLPSYSDGKIAPIQIEVGGKTWTVYSVGGSPAQAVLHAILEIVPSRLDLVVSGINYGENVGSGVTISGTVGAALEAASFGIPALAVSLETAVEHHYSVSAEVDFSTAAYFTARFGEIMLKHKMPPDVDVLKVEVPADATPETRWRMSRLSRLPAFEALPPKRTDWNEPAVIPYQRTLAQETAEDTDIYTIWERREVSVTPLSLDITSRIDLNEFEQQLRQTRKGL